MIILDFWYCEQSLRNIAKKINNVFFRPLKGPLEREGGGARDPYTTIYGSKLQRIRFQNRAFLGHGGGRKEFWRGDMIPFYPTPALVKTQLRAEGGGRAGQFISHHPLPHLSCHIKMIWIAWNAIEMCKNGAQSGGRDRKHATDR